MRIALALVVAISVSAAAASARAEDAKAPAPAEAQQTPSTFPPLTKEKCDNPSALGVERVVEIDTTGGARLRLSKLQGLRLPKGP